MNVLKLMLIGMMVFAQIIICGLIVSLGRGLFNSYIHVAPLQVMGLQLFFIVGLLFVSYLIFRIIREIVLA